MCDKKISKKIYEYAQREIFPKHAELKSVKMHLLPKEVFQNILLFFEIPVDLFIEERKKLENDILDDLEGYLIGCGLNHSIDSVSIIFLRY